MPVEDEDGADGQGTDTVERRLAAEAASFSRRDALAMERLALSIERTGER